MLNKRNISAYILAVSLIIMMAGCGITSQTSGTTTVEISQDNNKLSRHQQEYHPHPFWEESLRKPTLSSRKGRRYGEPPAIPEVTTGMDKLPAMTITAEIKRQNKNTTHHFIRIITRTKNRLHVSYKQQGQEWLFTRNPVDGRRAFGQLIDHPNSVILDYPDSDLADAGVGNGWSEIITMGIPQDFIKKLQPTGKTETRYGIVFKQYIRKNSNVSANKQVDEIWWNSKYFLPLRIIRDNGSWIQELTAIRFEINQDVLQAPHSRFPTYSSFDKADWKSCDANHPDIHSQNDSR